MLMRAVAVAASDQKRFPGASSECSLRLLFMEMFGSCRLWRLKFWLFSAVVPDVATFATRMVEELGEKLEGKAEVVTCMVSR